MTDTVQYTGKAVYRDGTLILPEPLDVAEESVVDFVVLYSEITDPQTQSQLLKAVTRRMRNNPLPANSIKFSREELHARR
ncbi:MAG: DUF104 domain-containing protein [Anaerolineae bacterium]|nr:DUF104 domain-containing protein [Anaerolineae bacterium]